MEPIRAKDAVIEFKKGDVWLPYQCATDAVIDFAMETVSVRTIGDGTWAKPRGQKKSYSITIGGLIKFDDEVYPHVFDLYAYYDNMVPIEYRMIFTIDGSDQLKSIEGRALPTQVTLGGGSTGFAFGNTKLEGDGAPEVGDVLSGCVAQITSGEMIAILSNNGFRINALSGGPVSRYDWAVDGSSRASAFVDGTLPDQFSLGFLYPIGSVSTHTLTVWPICDNGEDGIPFEIEFQAGEPN